MSKERATKCRATVLKVDDITYIAPIIVRRQIRWPDQCEAEVITPEVKQWRTCHRKGWQCVHRAKVDFRGQKLCLMHAQMRALLELAGPEPQFSLRVPASKPRATETRDLKK